MEKFINGRLISNPANWIIVFLMVALAYTGAGLIAKSVSQQQGQ